MPDDRRPEKGLLDTSVVVDLDLLPAELLPAESCISAVTLAELSAGPPSAGTPEVRVQRQAVLQYAEAALSPMPFGTREARAYANVFMAALKAGRKPRGARAVDALLAATALAGGMPLYTRNPDDFASLTDLVDVRGI